MTSPEAFILETDGNKSWCQ